MQLGRIGALASALFLGCVAFITIRLAYAESLFRRDDSVPIARAIELDRAVAPDGYYVRLAERARESGSGANEIRWLDAALAANPRLSTAWIARGLHDERERNYTQAERDLLEAARWDRRYLSAWTLANFYFRRANLEAFWPWARTAAKMTFDDYRPLLELAHAAEPHARIVLDRLGGGEKLARADLDYLIGKDQFSEAQQIARTLLAAPSLTDKPRLLELADRQVRAGNAAYALEIWDVFFPPLDPAHGIVLANGGFDQRPTNSVFDWRLTETAGVTAEWRPAELTLSFSGAQAELCSVLEQIIPLAPRAKQYQLSFEYSTKGLSSSTGLRWDLGGTDCSPIEASPSWRGRSCVFPAPSDRRHSLAALRLIYRREPGTVRAEGRIVLRALRMKVL